ncbi:Plasmid pRiA4b ORF-3-like protein [Pirellulimonas nuda]|uniref:Plasmid pRiA4b ORF-3-like protein n=1 Tax=Pirellulimonas nuda TaxID=2528009 RepID=A0A518D8W9_9BACT|nr:plasmid pRiA4b ORF-3 family protein [Pirellulimonas nuda]QDU87922.1 Plasmid pRiA4b ORF-3-like protein [Pirellulimonas nuda]
MSNEPSLNNPTTASPANNQSTLLLPLKVSGLQKKKLEESMPGGSGLASRLWEAGNVKQTFGVTLEELGQLRLALAAPLPENPSRHDRRGQAVLRKVGELISLGEAAERGDKRAAAKIEARWKRERVFQFTIALRGDFPTIWRTIHVKDCSLAWLARHFAGALGWYCTNNHRIEIDGHTYVMHDKTDTFGYDLNYYQGFRDESKVKISQLYRGSPHATDWIYVQGSNKSGRHDVWFAGPAVLDRLAIYPRCVAGEHAVPMWGCCDADDHAEFMKVRHLPDDERPDIGQYGLMPCEHEGSFDAKYVEMDMGCPPKIRKSLKPRNGE